MVHKTRRKENGKVQAEKTKVKRGRGKKEDFSLAVEERTGGRGIVLFIQTANAKLFD